ncbi:MAG TPA: DUF4126 domain-containing protein [Chthoniobacterales bacterium]|nr:DUF4126 domain-containing protein [Chthoniobacterales bacterium]
MERFNLLSVALGLACLAGINLYLTVFVTGLAIHQHWIVLSPTYQSLEVLGQPWIITLAGILYVLEFFADKIPWVDSAWDTVHTIIRPIGGALLAVQALGEHKATMEVLIILLAGTTSLVTHTAKASTRLVANSSPEPASNIGLSIAEDVAVFGGLALIHYNPVLAISIFALAIAAFLYFAPKVFRSMKARIWLALNKLNAAADIRRSTSLPIALPSRLAPIFSKQNLLGETIAWAVPCISGRGRRIPANLFGALVATNEEPHKIVFVARRNWKPFFQTVDLEGMTIAREPQFLSENLVLVPSEGRGPKYSFLFTRSRGGLVESIAEDLREKLARPAVAVPQTLAPEPVEHV